MSQPQSRTRVHHYRCCMLLAMCLPLLLQCQGDDHRTGSSTRPMGMGFGGFGGPRIPPTEPTFVSEVVSEFGGFRSPTRIAMDQDGSLYIADARAQAVAIVDQTGRRTGLLSGLEKPLGLAIFEPPNAPTVTVCEICVAPNASSQGVAGGRCHAMPGAYQDHSRGNRRFCRDIATTGKRVYVGDEGDGSVKYFEGRRLAGMLGAGPGEFVKPTGIAVSSDGVVYVADGGTNAVLVYDHQGTHQGAFAAFGNGGLLQLPSDIALNENLGEVYVSDFFGRRIAVYDLYGQWLRNIIAPPNDMGDPLYLRPVGLGLGAEGRLYVTDPGLCVVAVLDSMGTLLETYGYQQSRYWTGELSIPVDVIANSTHAFVVSNRTGRVATFEVTP